MTLAGTVVNGVVVPDAGATLPEGARVRIELDAAITYPHPLAPYDREKELALLRECVAEVGTGAPGVPLNEAFDRIAAELNLPPLAPGE